VARRFVQRGADGRPAGRASAAGSSDIAALRRPLGFLGAVSGSLALVGISVWW